MLTDLKQTKGIIFAGCSFTWGQGLYYYSNLNSLVEPLEVNTFDPKLLTNAHIKFMEKNRYSRFVANEMGSYEILKDVNGGSDFGIIDYWTHYFYSENENKIIEPYEDYSYFILQLTEPFRSNIEFHYNNIDMRFKFVEEKQKNSDKVQMLYNYMSDNNISYDEWENSHSFMVLKKVKLFLEFLENKNIKTKILTWPKIYVKHIMQDEWLKNRFITFPQCDSIEEIMYDKSMVIHTDYENFKSPPRDHHPSLKCHKLIADSIIKNLKKDI
jgi:hypothetical protein